MAGVITLLLAASITLFDNTGYILKDVPTPDVGLSETNITLNPGESLSLTQNFTIDSASADRVTRWGMLYSGTCPSFITCSVQTVSISLNQVTFRYSLSASTSAPAGVYNCQVTLDLLDDFSVVVVRRSYDHVITIVGDGPTDDHGDSCSEATALAYSGPSTSIDGSIETAGDEDYFRIVLPYSGDLSVYTTGSMDSFGTLLNSTCDSIVTNDDAGSGLNFRIDRSVGPGTYHVAVRHYRSTGTGSYVLTAEFEGEGDNGEPGLLYPQLALGGGYQVVLFVSNATTSSWQGSVRLCCGNGEEWSSPWSLDGVDRSGSCSFSVNLQPHATRKYVLSCGSYSARAGFLRIFGQAGSSADEIATSFFYNLMDGERVIDSIGVSPTSSGRRFDWPVEKTWDVDTGFAWARAANTPPFSVNLRLYDSNGNQVQTRTMAYDGHMAQFFSEVFNVPIGFVGKMSLDSEEDLHLTVIRLEATQSGYQLTNVPPTVPPPQGTQVALSEPTGARALLMAALFPSIFLALGLLRRRRVDQAKT